MDQERDEFGRFKSPANSNIDPELEKPLVQFSISNPFKRILYWLDQIRRKQTTTFMIKLSIPLIALPVVAFAFYQIGRGALFLPFISQSIPPDPKPTTITPSPSPDLQVSRSGTLKVAKGQQTRYLLSLKDGSVLLLELPANFNLDKYQNKLILVTGTLRRSTNILKVDDIAEIESLEPIPLPTSNLTPSPTTSPTASPSATPKP